MLLDLLISHRISSLFFNALPEEVHSELHRVVFKKLLALLATKIARPRHLGHRSLVSFLLFGVCRLHRVHTTDCALDALFFTIHTSVRFVFFCLVRTVQMPRNLPVILTAQLHLSHRIYYLIYQADNFCSYSNLIDYIKSWLTENYYFKIQTY